MGSQDMDPEQLIDAFRAAALSVTKLYKTSASAQTKARQDGYQECLDDLLAFLDREDMGLADGEGRRIRRWLSERRAGSGDAMVQDKESEDEVEKEGSEPEKQPDRTEHTENTTTTPGCAPPAIVPTQEHFTFSAPNLATLNLSDSAPPTPAPGHRARRVGRQASRTASTLGRGAGQKRRLNFAEIFDLGSLGNGKDMFGGGKRTRHI